MQDGERLKIEFKKDTLIKKKHTISALYEEEIPMRKMKKEREKREKELHAEHKMSEGVMITKDENVRNIQIRGIMSYVCTLVSIGYHFGIILGLLFGLLSSIKN